MNKSLSRRMLILSAGLAVTVVSTAWVSGREKDLSVDLLPSVSKRVSLHDVNTRETPLLLVKLPDLPKQAHRHQIRDLFAVASTEAPTAVPRMPLAPPLSPPPSVPTVEPLPLQPTAPPVPYRYLGRIQDNNGPWRAFLLKGNEIKIAEVGDMLEDIYRIEKISDDKIDLMYLPMNMQTVLVMGGNAR